MFLSIYSFYTASITKERKNIKLMLAEKLMERKKENKAGVYVSTTPQRRDARTNSG